MTGLAIDSRAVKPGDLFVAIVGERVDGHDFIDSALENGAVAIACTRSIDTICALTLRCPMQITCVRAFGRLMRDRTSMASVIGITGSAGKTTAKVVP